MHEDGVLAERCRAGDGNAARLLVRRHAQALRRFFVRRAVDAADDLVQQTFAACFLSLQRFRSEASFRSFLYGIARHELSHHCRRQKRLRELHRHAAALSVSPAADDCEPNDDVVLEHALSALPHELREVIELAYFEGHTREDIACRLEIPEGTVASRLRRAKDRLREHFAERARAEEERDSLHAR